MIEPVVAVAVVLALVVVDVVSAWVRVVGDVVGAGGADAEVVEGGAGAVVLEVDFDPPQPATSATPKRTASPLTFAG